MLCILRIELHLNKVYNKEAMKDSQFQHRLL